MLVSECVGTCVGGLCAVRSHLELLFFYPCHGLTFAHGDASFNVTGGDLVAVVGNMSLEAHSQGIDWG